MSFDDAIEALSRDAMRFVESGQVLGLGSGRAATAFVRCLSEHASAGKVLVFGVATSLQIKMEAQEGGIPMAGADEITEIDVVFDGADQIDARGNMIKGGGGALLMENILISAAKKVVIMADESKFAEKLNREVPVEVHPAARIIAAESIKNIGGTARLRLLERGYPFITENGNLILDCDFGEIRDPDSLRRNITGIAGVMEAGIFTRRPDVIYKAKTGGQFDVTE